jgi:CubicO group peptidase (beta-lactamase class C family)
MEGEWFAPNEFREFKTMTRFKKIATATLAALALASTLTATSAEAGYWGRRGYGWGVGAGVVGALAAGAIIAGATRPAYGGYYAYGPVRRCDMVERINRYGEVIGYRRVCGYY